MKGLRVLVLITIATWWGAATADVDEAAALVERAKEAVAYDMKDPSSAKFRELQIVWDDEETKTVCGEVNAKNSYGAYVGFRQFYYIEQGRSPSYDVDNGDMSAFPVLWKAWCTDHLKAKPES